MILATTLAYILQYDYEILPELQSENITKAEK
jgi:hypothetical protein